MDRNTCEIEHIQHIRVDHLVLQREPEKVELCDRTAALKREKRNSPRAHLLLHINPRRIDTLCCDVRTAVQNLIENGKPEIAHADLVDIGQCKRNFAVNRRPILMHGIPFTTRIPRRFQYRLQDAVIELHHCFIIPHTSIYTQKRKETATRRRTAS